MMGKITLVTGGARSGKSNYAEKLALSREGNVLYIATSIPFDQEMEDRIKKHKERRPANWYTYEGYKDLWKVYERDLAVNTILLDCVTIMITNLMFDLTEENIEELKNDEIDSIEKRIIDQIKGFLDTARSNEPELILVTNEVGYGIVPENKLARIFRDMAGRINQYIASRADEVYLVVCGIPMKVK